MISIDVGNRYIQIVDLKASGNDIKIQKFVTITTGGDFMDSDFSLDQALFKNAIREELSKIPSKDVLVTFSCLPHVSNVFTIPLEKKSSKMFEMIKSKVYQTLLPKEYIMDYRIVNTFTEENIKKCTVMVFMAPRSLVMDTRECILSLNKRPKGFMIAQSNIYDFAKRYLKGDSIIVAYISANRIDAHLLNFPDNIITRTSSFDKSYDIDILTGVSDSSDNSNDKIIKLEDIVSKLQQYQAIKYSKTTIQAIYLMGEAADDDCKTSIEIVSNIHTSLISELNLPLGTRQKELNNLIYAVGAGINVGR